MQTYHLDSVNDLQDVYDAVAEDFNETDYTDWMVDELVRMADLHRSFFRNQTGPDGAAWPPNAPLTIKRKGHRRILRGVPENKFRLSRSLTERVTRSTGDVIRELAQTDTAAYMSFGSAVEYSDIHDRDHRTSEGGFVPARRHVGLTKEHLDGMVNRVADHIVKELAK